MIPCEGLYADIIKDKVDIIDDNTPGMNDIIEVYEYYKNQFFKDIRFPYPIYGKEACSAS